MSKMTRPWVGSDQRKALDRHASTAALIALAAVAALPLILAVGDLQRLFWFGDDWGLLADATSAGLVPWILQPFAESFAPVFKLVWLAGVYVFHGSYLGMTLLLWASHLLNVLLAGTLLRRSGFGLTEVSVGAISLGLSWTNLETLTWSPQLSQLLSLTFFLLAWGLLLDLLDGDRGSAPRALLYGACLIVSGLCFARGLLGGMVLGIWLVGVSRLGGRRRRGLILLGVTTVCAVATLAVALHFSAGALGPVGRLDVRTIVSIGVYAAAYELLNPLLLVLQLPWQSLGATGLTALPLDEARRFLTSPLLGIALIAASVAAIKVAVELTALVQTSGRSRVFLLALLAFDLGNAILLEVGRYDLGLGTAVSSRYQYVSLLCFAPFLGVVLCEAAASAVHHPGTSPRAAGIATALVVVALGVAVVTPWHVEADKWAEWRGTAIRQALANGAPTARLDSATITVAQARKLARIYHLH